MTQQQSHGVGNPAISRWLMMLTYACGVVGLAIGIGTVNGDPPSLTWAVLVTVGGAGIVSFVRHAMFHRSDAARMGWEFGRTNPFQIETGLANLAWGLAAVLTVVFSWGLAAEATVFLVFGLYMLGASVAQVIYQRGIPMALGSAVFGGLMSYVGVTGLMST